MSLTPVVTKSDLQTAFETAFFNVAGFNVNNSPGATLGGIENAAVQEGINLLAILDNLDAASRLLTSSPQDAVTFVQQFGFQPEGPTFATTTVTGAPTSPPVSDFFLQFGSLLSTPTGVQFIVIPDSTQAAYTPSGYKFAAGSVTPVAFTVQALVSGSGSNVAAGTITQTVSGMGAPSWGPVTTIGNPAAVTNGVDMESTQAMIQRFQLWMSSGKVGTRNAIMAAVAGVQADLTYQVLDVVNPDTTPHPAFFTVFVNQLGQSAGPSTPLLVSVNTAISNVRSLGIAWTVLGPTLFTTNATATITVAPNFSIFDVTAACQMAFQEYIDNIGLNLNGGITTASLGQMYAILFAVPGVANVSNLLFNGVASDIIAQTGTQIISGIMSLSAT